jgi:formiminotetrahydrofolate cyclodeaminase
MSHRGLIRKLALITMDKAAYAHRKDLMRRTAAGAAALGRDFLAWVDEDTGAYQHFIAAKHLPQHTEEEKARYRHTLDHALQICIFIPHKILRAAVQGLRLGNAITSDYYTGTASDLGLAALSLKTAAQGAYLTILMNSKTSIALGLTQEQVVQHAIQKHQALLEEAETFAEAIYTQVRQALS